MERSGASSYVYAKASGMLAKSFVGKRAEQLFEAKSLSELWTLVFSNEVPLVPEMLLAKKIEQKAVETFIYDFNKLLSMYSKPDDVLVSMFQYFEYNNLKEIIAALCLGEKSMPEVNNIGDYSLIQYSAWPDIKKMTENTSVSWLSEIPEFSEQKNIDAKLDKQYVNKVWCSIDTLPFFERDLVRTLLASEFRMKNAIWALRLRVYYDMPKEEIIEHLAAASVTDENDILAGDAVKILNYSIDSYDDWSGWEYAFLLNPHEEGVVWNVDPRWVENASKIYIQKKALRQFHKHPFTAEVLVTWFLIKRYELDCIRMAAEGLRLNVSSSRMRELAGFAE